MIISSTVTLLLRPMLKTDLGRVLAWRNHPDVRQHMYTQHEITIDEHRRWFNGAIVDPSRHLLILEVDAEPQGYVNFCCDGSGGALWGFYLAPGAPKGTGRQLGKAATSYAFGTLGLEIIWGEVRAENVASHRFHLSQGFMPEALLSDRDVAKQRMSHIHRYFLSRSAWQARQGKLNDQTD